jgi:hypothetical protein
LESILVRKTDKTRMRHSKLQYVFYLGDPLQDRRTSTSALCTQLHAKLDVLSLRLAIAGEVRPLKSTWPTLNPWAHNPKSRIRLFSERQHGRSLPKHKSFRKPTVSQQGWQQLRWCARRGHLQRKVPEHKGLATTKIVSLSTGAIGQSTGNCLWNQLERRLSFLFELSLIG